MCGAMSDTSQMLLLRSGLLVSSQRHRPCSLSALPTALSADQAPIVTAKVKTATEVPCGGTFRQIPERGALTRRNRGRCKRVMFGELHQGGLSIFCGTRGEGHSRKTSLWQRHGSRQGLKILSLLASGLEELCALFRYNLRFLK